MTVTYPCPWQPKEKTWQVAERLLAESHNPQLEAVYRYYREHRGLDDPERDHSHRDLMLAVADAMNVSVSLFF